jgi:CheY-like chemotaxis protein
MADRAVRGSNRWALTQPPDVGRAALPGSVPKSTLRRTSEPTNAAAPFYLTCDRAGCTRARNPLGARPDCRAAEPSAAEPSAAESRRAESVEVEHRPPQTWAESPCGGSSRKSRQQAPCALIVDDDPEVCRALARCLKPEIDVCLAGSVGQADTVLAQLERVDVAFVDLDLPDGTGEEILERLARWPDAIRILISGRLLANENPLRNRALATLVLGKPLAFHVVEALKRATLGLPIT